MENIESKLFNNDVLFTIEEASKWACNYLKRDISESNISYLIQYGKIKKISDNGTTQVSKNDLINYYKSYRWKRELNWKKKLGSDINWTLSFDYLREKDTTKHVHRLHPYKGKFIPQLVEYFLDDHINNFKKEIFFNKGDIILDPFCGSGTTMVQANELGMNCIGIDVSAFNAFLSNAKIFKYDLIDVYKETKNITSKLNKFAMKLKIPIFEQELLNELYEFNNKYFPSPDFKYKVIRNKINENEYGLKKSENFLPVYQKLIKKHQIKLKQLKDKTFLYKWYIQNTRNEIEYAFKLLKQVKNTYTKIILSIILSRAIRSCRATTHSDLATLKKPQFTSYYCVKHKKICKPLFSIRGKWETYSKDTLKRLSEFVKLRTDTFQRCLAGDSRSIDIFVELEKKNKKFAALVKKKKINGIFSSPPYVGLINYHEQHASAYNLFGFKRKDKLEIGPLFNGQGKAARDLYIKGIANVLNNCKKYLIDDFNIFLVANDKYNLYPTIAEKADMQIINQYKRPVLNRTERGKGAFSEIIFHLKNK